MVSEFRFIMRRRILSRTKFIENFISKFREENVDWKYWVPPLLAMWDKKVEMKKTRISKPESDEVSILVRAKQCMRLV